MDVDHRATRTASRTRRAAAVLAAVLSAVLAATGLSATDPPARAATALVIDSPADCQRLFTLIGATIGSVGRRTCYVSSEGSEVHLPAGHTVTIAPGWEVMVDSVVFFNEGTIRNRGFFRASGDVVNNVGSAVFDNAGRLILGVSDMSFLDQSVFLNREKGHVELNIGGLSIGDHGYNRGVIDVATSLQVGGTLVNHGKIRIAHGGEVPGNIVGRPPVVMPYDEAPVLVSSYPTDGAVGVPRRASIVLTFSEPVTAIRSWYSASYLLAEDPPVRAALRTRYYRVAPNKYVIDPIDPLPAGAEIFVWFYTDLVTDQDRIDPPGAWTPVEYFVSLSFTTR
ncbi:hypothetical protein E8D34_17025 [Nocardioides sp. GY 10113]|uniref:Ig-like domain-containing protein n=1 Tax=Nocardioides sp. GY 10113 TaxID=2569761 RepID=UPI0010A79D1A|nr:Ig-like domain-containing protein [Nocardioides sp. GY 10113]TIC82187.1 hypothetical protein E8D34_17025 [Nocardioides sp. GY 10113]